MPDREKVIAWLADEELYYRDHGDTHNSIMACDALELLKEYEPKQIVRKQVKRENSDGSTDYFAEWYCPHCNSLILRRFDNPSIKFCYKCGKPIMWEGSVK